MTDTTKQIDPIEHTLKRGAEYPYHGQEPKTWAEVAACAILYDLNDRRGIKHALREIDNDVRAEIVESFTKYIERAARATPVSPAQPDLHSAIMNLPCNAGRAIAMNGASMQAYKQGHRDARHAAAELVAASVGAQVAPDGAVAGEPKPLGYISKYEREVLEGGEYIGCTIFNESRPNRDVALYTAPVPAPATVSMKEQFARLLEIQKREAETGDPYMVGLYNGMTMMCANVDNDMDWRPLHARATAPAPVAVAPVAGEGLTAYLMREMPAGTVIGDPAWWASKIARALSTQAERQPQPANCPNGCTGPERGGAGCMAVTGECAMDSTAPAAPSAAQAAGVEPNWKELLDAAVDIYFDGIENPPEGRVYVSDAFPNIMDECRAALATTPSEGVAAPVEQITDKEPK